MSSLRRQPRSVSRPPALEARVSNADPERLTVTLDAFDGGSVARHEWAVASWPTVAGSVPARGDRCLVVMAETGRPWVVAAEWTGTPRAVEPWRPQWRTLPFASGWSELNPAIFPVGYTKSPDGWVSFKGAVRKSNVPANYEPVFGLVLPAGFCPGSYRSFPSSFNGTAAAVRIQVGPGGDLVIGEVPAGAAPGAWWSLDGIGYWAEN